MSTFHTINPATEEIIREYTYASDEELSQQIDAAQATWLGWKKTSYAERAKLFIQLAQNLISQKESLGKLITTEMGKPLAQSISEIEKCAWVCEYYAEKAEGFLKDQTIATDAKESYIHFNPIGIVLAIMPWNFPFWQVFRFAAPSLMAGNVGLLRHSSNTIGCALKMQELFEEAGFPKYTFSTLRAHTEQVEQIIANPKIQAVTFTGSTSVGRTIGEVAGRNLKKSVLELGGSDAYVILDDADLEYAAKTCVSGRLLNTGQSCIAAKRFIVTEKNAAKFTALVKAELDQKTYGNPLNENDLGSMAKKELRNELHEQVKKSIEAGAKCPAGGVIPESKGYFYPATLLVDVSKDMPAYNEELFGPVAVIITAKDEQEAIKIANDTSYGLGSGVFTSDEERGKEIAENELEAGSAFINTFVKSDPRLPFGGIKESGYGRELSLFGIHEFVNIKTVYLK